MDRTSGRTLRPAAPHRQRTAYPGA